MAGLLPALKSKMGSSVKTRYAVTLAHSSLVGFALFCSIDNKGPTNLALGPSTEIKLVPPP
jgi:hypothetical protein